MPFLNWLVEATNIPVFSFPPFGPTQALDILIIAGILYFALGWIRRTQAWVLIKGLFFVLMLRLVADMFELVTLGWLLENAFTVGLIAIIVLFQPELRKFLEQMGRGQYLASFKIESEQTVYVSDDAVSEIIKAAKSMSNTDTGALVVIEQSIDLGEQERTGITLDAQVSHQLLLNIFEKNTPLHDGAVIIRQNRVVAAKCILPLSSDESLDSSLGTRHRAAVGISEVSDARVIVVSEETGTISVALDGKLTRNVSETKIRDLLVRGEPVKPRFAFLRSKSAKKRKDD